MIRRLQFILIGCCICLGLFSQERSLRDSLISVEFKNESLLSCVRKMQNNANLYFTYSAADLEQESKTVTAAFSSKPVSQVLDVLFKSTQLSYKFLGGHIVIFKKKENYTISGFVRDAQTGEVLIGASVFLKSPLLGTSTNAYGFYSLSLPKSSYNVFVSFISVEEKVGELQLRSDTTLNIKMSSEVNLNEIEVKAGEVSDKVKEVVVTEKINIETVKKIPAPFGEPDILRRIQMLPGIQTISEASLGYYVRGGSFSQNLVLLDDAPVYNPTHLMGVVSAFNMDMVKSVDFFKGGIPSGYQSGASSVMDIRTKDGNNKNFGGGGGLGLVSSRLFLEGPLKKDKSSFFLAGRKSIFPDIFLKSGFHDINLKLNHTFNDRNRLYISAYAGSDYFRYEENRMSWRNSTFTLRYNHVYSGKLFSNTSLIYSKFRVGNAIDAGDSIHISTEQFVENRIAKHVFSFYARPGTVFNAGVYVNHQLYSPFTATIKFPGIDTTFIRTAQRNAIEAAAFVEASHELTRRLSFNIGLRAPLYRDNTRSTLYYSDGFIYDSTIFKPTTFKALEPRASIRFLLNRDQSLNASYNHINQFQQQFQGGSLFNLVHLWLPSSSALKPQTVDQLSLGYFLKKKKMLFSLETFYKQIMHASDFVDDAQLMNSSFFQMSVEDLLRDGTATAYGIEFAANRTEGRFTGWLNYTLSKTTYHIKEINNGKPYPSSFDNRHTVSLGLVCQLNKKWEVSMLFNYRSGRAFSFPDSYYELGGNYYSRMTERNKERTQSYHRLDLSAIYSPQTRNNKFHSTWIFSLMNTYNKFNPTYYTIVGREITGFTIFPICPSVTYNFKF